MDIRKSMHLSTLAILLAGGSSLVAQVTTGALKGTITDPSGNPIVGARVVLESPALFQPRVFQTDAKGEYRGLLLPVGNYTVKVSAKDHLGRTNADVRIGVGANLSLDFVLKPTKVESAVVEVVSNLAMQSKGDDKVSSNYSAEELSQLPVNRDFNGAMALTPGITGGGINSKFRGAATNQTNYSVDGISVKDDRGNSQYNLLQTSTTYQPLQDSVEDIQVVLSPLNARYGRTQGGMVNLATKSGSNTFEGTVRAYVNRNSWSADNGVANAAQTNLFANEDFSRHYEITLSGPIIKDRLWFYVGGRVTPSEAGSPRVIGWQIASGDSPTGYIQNADDLSKILTGPLGTYGTYPGVDAAVLAGPGGNYNVKNSYADYGTTFSPKNTFDKVEGKLTGMVNDSNFLTASFIHSKDSRGGYTNEGNTPFIALTKDAIGSNVVKVNGYSLSWNSNISASTTLEARIAGSKQETQQPYFQEPGYDNGSVFGYFTSTNIRLPKKNPNSGGRYHFGPMANAVSTSSPTPSTEGNQSIMANLKTIQDWHGSHDMDFGVELFKTKSVMGHNRLGNRGLWDGWYTDPSQQAGKTYLYPVFYTADGSDLSTHTAQRYYKDFYGTRGPSASLEYFPLTSKEADNISNALWVNDTYTINSNWNALFGLRVNKLQINDSTGNSMVSTTLVEPRFQIKWNPDGNSKHIFSFSMAKLASSYTDALAETLRGDEWFTRDIYHWSGLHDSSGNLIQQGLLPSDSIDQQTAKVKFVTYADLGNLANYGDPVDFIDRRQTRRLNGLTAPYAIETTLGYDRNFDNGTFHMALVQRVFKNDWVLATHPVYGMGGLTLVTDPTGKKDSKGVVEQAYEQTNVFLNDDHDRTYRGVEVSWNRKLTEALTFGGSAAYSQSNGRIGTDYYNYQNLRAALTPAQQAAAVGEGVLGKSLVLNAFLTYVVPVGKKGNVSASILANYYTADLVSFSTVNDYAANIDNFSSRFMDWDTKTDAWGAQLFRNGNKQNGIPVIPVDTFDGGGGQGAMLAYNQYIGGINSYKRGYDVTTFNVKLAANVPIVSKVVLLATLQLNNVFNQNIPIGSSAWVDMLGNSNSGDNGPDATNVWGHVANNHVAWGSWGRSKDQYQYSGGRTVTEFSIGLKF